MTRLSLLTAHNSYSMLWTRLSPSVTTTHYGSIQLKPNVCLLIVLVIFLFKGRKLPSLILFGIWAWRLAPKPQPRFTCSKPVWLRVNMHSLKLSPKQNCLVLIIVVCVFSWSNLLRCRCYYLGVSYLVAWHQT